MPQVSRQSVLYPSAAKLRSTTIYQHNRKNFSNLFNLSPLTKPPTHAYKKELIFPSVSNCVFLSHKLTFVLLKKSDFLKIGRFFKRHLAHESSLFDD